MNTPPHLVIIGGGFAGLFAARGLAGEAIKITLVDRRNYHLFQPLLYQVATAGLSSPDIAAPLRHIFRAQKNIEVLLGKVEGIDPAAREVRLDGGQRLQYDYLMLATGAAHSYFGRDDWASVAPGLKTLEDALGIRRRLLIAFERAEREENPQRRDALLSFAIVGAGPTGVELAGTLAEIARHTLRNDFRRIDPSAAKVRLIEAGPRVLAAFPEDLSRKAHAQLTKLGVEVLLGKPVEAIDEDGVQVGGERIPARTVLWAAGVGASALAKDLGAPLDKAGRVLVQSDLRVPGHPEIFVAGDLASLQQDGHPVPGVAAAAKQMGAYVARALRAERAGKSLAPFRYKDVGTLATIGRRAAVVNLPRLKLSGYSAWLFWLLVHIFFLIGFRNRIVVMIEWGWSYWTYQRGARIILETPEDTRPFR